MRLMFGKAEDSVMDEYPYVARYTGEERRNSKSNRLIFLSPSAVLQRVMWTGQQREAR